MCVSYQLMNLKEFEHYRIHSSQEYAKSSPHFKGMSKEDALTKSLELFQKLFPEGLETPMSHPFTLQKKTNKDAINIGYLHLSEVKDKDKYLYVWNFYLNPEERGKGYGKKLFALILESFKLKGYKRVGLNVFANNTNAIGLYKDLGFIPTQMNMELEFKAK